MAEEEAYARRLRLTHYLREPAIRAAVECLDIPPASRGLDAGCGIGQTTAMLARAAGPAGRVTGLDLSPEHLALAGQLGEELSLSGQLSFREGDMTNLPFQNGEFDWVWSCDTIWPGPRDAGCPIEEPLPVIRELARVVRPGGTLAILFWTSQKLLPGHPLLEAWLNTTSVPNYPFSPGMAPRLHVMRAQGWLRAAGLEELSAHTFLADVHAPLSAEFRKALLMTMDMFWGQAEPEVATEDWAAFQRLCEPGSPVCIVDDPDYYGFLTYSMFRGRVPA
jgi:demethylmenaquinone methyltransferase/2-methoxy-6-polyprenyl-1,4-benzoquinol methylase